MGQPVIIAENLLSERAFPNHVVSATEEPAGGEAWRAADGRREASSARPTSTNLEYNLDVQCDRVRGVDILGIDRMPAALLGKQVKLQHSQDNYTTTRTMLDVTLPTVSAPATLDEGVLTEEGSYLRRMPVEFALYWRLNIPAMGAGLRPELPLVWIARSYQPAHFGMPWDEDATDLLVEEETTQWAWRGRGAMAIPRSGEIRYQLKSLSEYDADFRLHVLGHLGTGRPTWLVFDEAQADRAVLAIREGRLGAGFEPDWGYRQTRMRWVEHDAKRL